MKKSFIILSSIFLFFVGLVTYQVNVLLNKYPTSEKIYMEDELNKIFIPVLNKIPKKEKNVITFILGEDSEMDNPYYTQAENYYRNHPSEKGNWLNTECRSLKDVISFLEKHSDSEPWNKINLVVHSNEWRGIGLPISENGGRITVESIEQALKDSTIEALPNSVINHQTEIIISGCALGKNEALLAKMATVFGGNDSEVPTVRSSKYFITYTSENGSPEKYFTAYYHTNFKTGYKPGEIKLANALKEQYPSEELDFRDALSRKSPRFSGDVYHYTFNIPVNWIVTFANESDRPNLENKEAESLFLNEQNELLEIVEEFNIPVDKFRWQFKSMNYTFEDGTVEPAILIKGKTSVLCVLKSFTQPDSVEPYIPSATNEVFFTTIKNQNTGQIAMSK